MTRKPDDWMPLNVRKYLGDTMHLTTEQHGAYLLLLMAYWMRGGPLPGNDNELAAITRTSRSEWKRLKPGLSKFFNLTEDGHLIQKRAEEELSKARRMTADKARSGALGAKVKWNDVDAQTSADRLTRSQRLAEARQKGTHTKEEWGAMLIIFGGHCVRCKKTCDSPVKDHITPIYRGGSDAIENLQPLCRSCNSSKGPETTDHRANVLQDWRERLAKCLAGDFGTPAPLPLPIPLEKKDSDCFDEFFSAYPKQEQRDNAEKAYAEALAGGAKPDELIAGAKRFAAHVERDKIPTKFIALAKNWLRDGHWKDSYGAPQAEIVLPPLHPSWPADVAKRWTKNLGEVTFRTYFGQAEYVEADPVRLCYRSKHLRRLAEEHCPQVAKEVSLELAA